MQTPERVRQSTRAISEPVGEELDQRELLRALQAMRDGDFSVRLPGHQVGMAGKIADTFNEIVSSAERLAQELERSGQIVGREGKTRHRMALRGRHGAWNGMERSFNTLVDDLLWPTTEVTRTIAAVAKVVHDYGDICQTITEIAIEQRAPITVEEFHTLNRCLDTAIAEAVTEHGRLATQRRSDEEVERLGQAAHELRDLLNGALLAFHALKRGTVAINGSTGAVLGRSLTDLRNLVDRTLSEVRLVAGKQRRERLDMTSFVDEIAAAGILHSEYRGITFTVLPVDPALAFDADPQLLASAVMNLLHNAFKYTRPGGAVVLRVHAEGERLLLTIQDECGGIPESKADLFQAFGERRGADRSGLGLGLSIARQAVRAHGGDIRVRNMPGHGCVFTIDLPLALEEGRVLQSPAQG